MVYAKYHQRKNAAASRGRTYVPHRMASGINPDTSFVKQIVKKEINRVAETKSYLTASTIRSCTDDFTYYQNLTSAIAQGGGSENRLGEKITAKSIRIHWDALLYNTSTNSESKTLRLIVFTTKDKLGLTNGVLTQSSIYRAPINSASAIGFIDTHKVNILVDRKVNVETQLSGINQRRTGVVVVPFKGGKNLMFTDDAVSTYLKGNQLYFAFGYYSSGGILAYMDFKYQYSVNFSDL